MASREPLDYPVFQAFDANGAPLSNGTVEFFDAGTTDQRDTYSDPDLTTTNPNPVTLNSRGEPESGGGTAINIYLDNQPYKMVLKDSSGSTIRTVDNYIASSPITVPQDPADASVQTTDDYEGVLSRDPEANEVFTVDFQSANTTTTPTFENTNGSLGAKTLTTKDGSALWAGAVSGVHELQYASGTDTYLVLEPRVANVALDARWFASIQAAVDAVTTATVDSPTSAGSTARQQIFLAGKEYDETVDITSAFDGASIIGMGVGSHLWTTDADHTLHIQSPAQNINLYNFWVDQSAGSGNFDAVHIESGGEVRLDNMDVDFAPRNAIYVNSGGCKISNTEVSGGGKTAGLFTDSNGASLVLTNCRFNQITHGTSADAIKLTSRFCSISNVYIDTCDGHGIVLDKTGTQDCHVANTTIKDAGNMGIYCNGANNTLNATILSPASDGIRLDSQANGTKIDVSVVDPGSVGVNVRTGADDCTGIIRVSGTVAGTDTVIVQSDRCSFQLVGIPDGTTQAVKITGDDNHITGTINGSIGVSGSNNRIDAVITGSITDSGTGTIINGLGEESANAETPTAANYKPGDIVDFTDSGDATGDGQYLLLRDGSTWVQIA